MGYNKIHLPVEKLKKLFEELEKNWQKYQGNNNQTALAEKVGISHLGQLFSALSNLTNDQEESWANVLGYNVIDLPVERLKKLLLELQNNWQEYIGNSNQVKLAEKVGIFHLGHLFSALSNLTDEQGKSWAEVLEYNYIDLPAGKVAKLLLELRKNWQKYTGNSNQVKLAEKVGISNLGQLFSALSNLTNDQGKSWAEVLEYNDISLPAGEVTKLLEDLENNWEKYQGNNNQTALAEKVGISHLGQLFSALSNLTNDQGESWAKVLGYNEIHLPVAIIKSFFGDFIAFTSNSEVAIYQLTVELRTLSPQQARQRFFQIKENYAAVEATINRRRREDWPAAFYDYLLKTLSLAQSAEEAAAFTGEIITYISENEQRIYLSLSQLSAEQVSYEHLRTLFGGFTVAVIKFYGNLRSVLRISQGSPGWITNKGPFPIRDQFSPGPLELLLIKRERTALLLAISSLTPEEQAIIRAVYYNDELPDKYPGLDEILKKLEKLITV